jgi:hypothetical protein
VPFTRPGAAAPRGRANRPVVEFGLVRGGAAANSTLLPAALLASTGQGPDSAPHRTAVRLPSQGLQAWRYRDLQPVGTNLRLTLYTVPTSAGVATVVCALPPSLARSLAPQCDAIAGSLRLKRATPYPIGSSSSYASALNSTIGSLQQTSQAQKAGLESAQTLAGQAAAAQALATSYAAAAGALSALRLSPADRAANTRLVAALHGAAGAYRRAARAAKAGNPDAYRTASAAIPAATAQVNAALAAIRAGGYTPASQGGGAGAASGGSQTGGHAGSASSDEESDVGDSRSDDPSDDSADP